MFLVIIAHKRFVILILLFFCCNLYAQQGLRTKGGSVRSTSSNSTKSTESLPKRDSKKATKIPKAKIQDYKIISRNLDTVYLDTTLTIQKEYKFNYLRRDYFELLPFSNMGQTYNSLSKNLYSRRMLPSFGSKAKHYNYMDLDDIYYYHVPTPLTELMFKTSFEQGQLLDAFFTVNTSCLLYTSPSPRD